MATRKARVSATAERRVISAIAERAWGEAPVGESRIDERHRVVRSGKMLLVIDEEKSNLQFLRIVAFPKPEHMEAFLTAADGVAELGPASHNPGAIGTLQLVRWPDNNREVFLNYAQTHAKTGASSYAPVKRGLLTYYGGWRVRALEQAIRYAHEKRKTLVLKRSFFEGLPGSRARLMADLREACRRTGAEISEEKYEIKVRKAALGGAGR